MGSETKPPPRMAKTQPLHTEPYIDYSETQDVLPDNILYHLAFIQNSRYIFGVEERIALPLYIKRCSELLIAPFPEWLRIQVYDTHGICLGD